MLFGYWVLRKIFVLSLFFFIEFVDFNFDSGISIIVVIFCNLLDGFEYLIRFGFWNLEKVFFFVSNRISVFMVGGGFFSFKVFFEVDFLWFGELELFLKEE